MCAALFITQSCQFDIKCMKRGENIIEIGSVSETDTSILCAYFGRFVGACELFPSH